MYSWVIFEFCVYPRICIMSLCNCSLFLYYSQLLKERVEKKGCLELSSDQLIGLLCICVIVTCKWNFES